VLVLAGHSLPPDLKGTWFKKEKKGASLKEFTCATEEGQKRERLISGKKGAYEKRKPFA